MQLQNDAIRKIMVGHYTVSQKKFFTLYTDTNRMLTMFYNLNNISTVLLARGGEERWGEAQTRPDAEEA